MNLRNHKRYGQLITAFLLILALTQACKDDVCDECFSPPQTFLFDVVSKDTGENLFTNGTYQPSQIEITDLVGGNAVDFTFIDENDSNLISINSIGWQTEEVNISVAVDGKSIFTLQVDAKRVTEDCCSFTRYDEVAIHDASFEFDDDAGVYKILL